MSNYMEADVERDEQTALEHIDGQRMGVMGARAAVRRLKAAALEGAKVPGLVADNAALGSVLAHAESNCALRIQEWLWAPEVKEQMQALLDIIQPAASAWRTGGAGRAFCDEVFALRGQVYALGQTETKLRSEVSALQARVAELERERDDQLRLMQATLMAREKDQSERDALRAQVTDLVDLWDSDNVLRKLAPASTPNPGQRSLQVLVEAMRLALSAPPAEMPLDWRAPGDLQALVALCVLSGTDTIIRAFTEGDKTFEFDSSELAALVRSSAETTPAPERADDEPTDPNEPHLGFVIR